MDPQLLAEVRRLTAVEDDAIAQARSRATGVAPTPEVGALLAWAAATVDARAAVEVGAACGVTGLWIARGLGERGVLTSIEADPHAHSLADDAFSQSSGARKVRGILGEPATVLPRLSDGGYDLMVLQSRPADYPEHLDHARRLLRPGGVLIARDVLRRGEAGGALATFLQRLAEDTEFFTTTVLPLDDGIALATRREPAESAESE
jgi:predicted O-methyltransferase YrrM